MDISKYLRESLGLRDNKSQLYIYIKNFKNVLVINLWTDFNITWQECVLGDPLPRLFKPHDWSKKIWLLGGGAYYLSI